MKPGELVTLVFLLGQTTDAVAETARATFAKLPAPVLTGALNGALQPAVLDALARAYSSDLAIVERVLQHAELDSESIIALAQSGDERVTELIATNEQRLLAEPKIIEALYKNAQTRMSTADRLIELAVRNHVELSGIAAFKEAAQAIMNELIAEPSAELSYDDLAFKAAAAVAALSPIAPGDDTHELDETTGKERVKTAVVEQEKRFEDLSISGKIRRAIMGNTSDRMLAIRDANPLVRIAAAKSDLLSESEAARITANRGTNEDVLREIAKIRDFTRNHQIRLNLVTNPRTPLAFASRFVTYLRDHELRNAAGSKDVPGAIATLCRQQLSRKGR
jgi:hypothetical protein